MIGELAAGIGLAIDFIDDHPEVAKMLMEELRDFLGLHKDEPTPSVEAMRGLAAGMAARAAVAVQEVSRRRVSMERARAAVTIWVPKTTARNQLLLQQPDVAEMCAELLHDVAALVRT